jgi:hypothetical protein
MELGKVGRRRKDSRECSELLGFWTLSIARYSKKHERIQHLESGSVSVLR